MVGKAVLVANKIPLLRRYDRAALIRPILFKTAFYWAVVFLARLFERFERFFLARGAQPARRLFHYLGIDLLVASISGDFAVDHASLFY